MSVEIRHPASITKAELTEGAKHYGKANAGPCTIDGKMYGAELVLVSFIGTMGKDRLLHGHYMCRIRRPAETELPTYAFRTLPGWEPTPVKPVVPKPVKLNTRKAVKRNGVHTQN